MFDLLPPLNYNIFIIDRYEMCIIQKIWIEGRLGYNDMNDRYGLLVSDLWEYDGFHCGDYLQVKINGEWIDTTMEMSWENVWYLTDTNIRGKDLEYTVARIQKVVY